MALGVIQSPILPTTFRDRPAGVFYGWDWRWWTGSQPVQQQLQVAMEERAMEQSGLDCVRLAEVCKVRRPVSAAGLDKCAACGFAQSYTASGAPDTAGGGADSSWILWIGLALVAVLLISSK